ncbi:MAG: cytochrome-c oxidase, cbb3-type subunit III [Thiothrix sp.]|nr:cytochrome-c oxidase, cbb3-type subunit III [Thiothrix sp.]
MSVFWSGWVIVITLANIFACYWLIRWTSRKRPDEVASGTVTGHQWDGLQEYNNPLPRWWLWMFYLTMIFGIGYLLLYPGLGSFKGLLGWSSHDGRYVEEMAQADQEYGPLFRQYAAMPIPELAQNQEAQDMGRRMFLNYCAQCHGSDAGGSPGYPSLRDRDWLYGGAPEQIETSILKGRQGAMPAHAAMLSESELDGLVLYVMSLSTPQADNGKVAIGQKLFMERGCIACHGLDAKGNPALGAPDLTDKVWLYGSSRQTVRETIANGRQGLMPAHADFLGPDKVHLLAAYVYGLSAQEGQAQTAGQAQP